MRKYRATLHLIYNSQEVLFDQLPPNCEGHIAPHGNLVFESKSPIDKTIVTELLKNFVLTDVVIYEGLQLLMKTVLVTSYIIFISQPLLAEHILSSEPLDHIPGGHKVYPKTKMIGGQHCLLIESRRSQYYKNIETIYNFVYDFRRLELENEK